ncbi:MAG: F0F1 ATP synthase subunit A [Nitrospiraceae bacterium]|nr:F0F1 ATP synthase subunit A [Nitrospiraceae bacterium]
MEAPAWWDLFINPHVVPRFVSGAFLADIILILTALIIRASISVVPGGLQNFVELINEVILNLSVDNIGPEWGEFFFPFLGTIFIFVLVCNTFSEIPGFGGCPTSSLYVTASMGVPVFIVYQLWGLKMHGAMYVKHFLGPIRSVYAIPFMMAMFVIEMMSHLARPLTLSVRLFGNMFAHDLLLFVLAVMVPLFLPISVLVLGLLIVPVQAYVITLLSTLYIAGATQHAH